MVYFGCEVAIWGDMSESDQAEFNFMEEKDSTAYFICHLVKLELRTPEMI